METKMTASNALKRCKLITTAILFLGLGSALAIYFTAAEAPADPFAEFEKSKKFAYELERMGGKAALAANDLNKWFAGLWQGETLAYTVAIITVVVAAGFYFVATGLAAEVGQHPEEIRPTPFSE
jgi:hypothetical protein